MAAAVPDLASQSKPRIGPKHPRLGDACGRAAEWLATKLFARAGFHRLGSAFADSRIAEARERLARGETLYLAGLGAAGTHNSGVALVEVTQDAGPRLILNNEEERFSGTKHTTEYPRQSIDAMVAALRGMGRDVSDIFAWLTTWDYPALAGTLARTLLEEAPQPEAATHHAGRRLRRASHGCDDAHPKSSGQTAWFKRARAADPDAAS